MAKHVSGPKQQLSLLGRTVGAVVIVAERRWPLPATKQKNDLGLSLRPDHAVGGAAMTNSLVLVPHCILAPALTT